MARKGDGGEFLGYLVCTVSRGDSNIRQIAGKLARKIRWYLNEGDEAIQNAELGFIKFGSRVDLFLPVGTKIEVDLKQKVKGGITVIGSLPVDED